MPPATCRRCGIFPDQLAPVVRTGTEGPRKIVRARWGMPSPAFKLLVARWTAASLTCATPVASLAALAATRVAVAGTVHLLQRELAQAGRQVRAGLVRPGREPSVGVLRRPLDGWTCTRKVTEGGGDLRPVRLLTTEPNLQVASVHPKAMPVILTTSEEAITWLAAPWTDARRLQRSLPDGVFRIVARGEKEDRRPARGFLPKLHPCTLDSRYSVVRGRLWRLADLAFPPERHATLVRELMAARRAMPAARGDGEAVAAARARADAAKRALGERGMAWWDDGAPDYNRRTAANT